MVPCPYPDVGAFKPISGLILGQFTRAPVQDSLQVPDVKRFAEKTPGRCRLGTLNSRFIDVGRQINDGNQSIGLDLEGSVDPIHMPL